MTTSRLDPIQALDDELRGALAKANEFIFTEAMRWSSVDLIKAPDQSWVILECSVGWTLNGFYECNVIDAQGRVLDQRGDKVWEILIDEIEAGSFA